MEKGWGSVCTSSTSISNWIRTGAEIDIVYMIKTATQVESSGRFYLDHWDDHFEVSVLVSIFALCLNTKTKITCVSSLGQSRVGVTWDQSSV